MVPLQKEGKRKNERITESVLLLIRKIIAFPEVPPSRLPVSLPELDHMPLLATRDSGEVSFSPGTLQLGQNWSFSLHGRSSGSEQDLP